MWERSDFTALKNLGDAARISKFPCFQLDFIEKLAVLEYKPSERAASALLGVVNFEFFLTTCK